MSIRSKLAQWGNVSRFCVERMADYGELFSIDGDYSAVRSVRAGTHGSVARRHF
jgi:hypothetical protein